MKSAFHKRLADIQERVLAAAQRSGRSPEGIRIVGVSKRHSADACCIALEAGLLDLGENYVQEWQEKASRLTSRDPAPRWHFIGGLQSNKAKHLVSENVLIHTVDRVSLAKTLAKEAARQGKTVSILIQVNEAREAQKGGVTPEKLPELVTSILELPHLQIQGLMCIPPNRSTEKESRADFTALRTRLEELHRLDERLLQATELSMGMSNDFEWAVEEGATLVRIGTALFGPRPL